MATRSLVKRLRAVGVIVAVVSLVLIATETAQLRAIGQRMDAVTARTEPLADLVHEMPRIGRGISDTIAQIRSAEDPAELDAQGERLVELLHAGRVMVLDSEDIRARVLFADAESITGLIDHQRELIEQADALQALTAAQIARLELLSPILRARQQQIQHDHVAAMGDGPAAANRDMALLTQLAEIRTGLAAVHILIDSLTRLPVGEAMALKPQLTRRVGAVAIQVARLPAGDLQVEMAGEIRSLQEALFGADGVFDRLLRVEAAREGRQEALDRARLMSSALSDWADEAANGAVRDFVEAGRESKAAVDGMVMGIIVSRILLWATCILLLWLLIERMLITRLARVAKQIRAISRGDLDNPVPVTGRDEVGEIEQAVERSRQMGHAMRESNEELQRFVYAAAHDLRAPLRAVTSLVQWSREDFSDEMPSGLVANLDLIDARVNRLSSHLDALLAYFRAGTDTKEIGAFDLHVQAELLRTRYGDRPGFEIVVSGAPPLAMTYVTPMSTILVNLVGNAIKHHDAQEGRIVLSAHLDRNEIVYRVADDGPGIEPEFQNQIFGLFQTLKPRDQVEGSGLGLALVQKLASLMGGSVEVSSEPGLRRGTEFSVRLPLGEVTRVVESEERGIAA